MTAPAGGSRDSRGWLRLSAWLRLLRRTDVDPLGGADRPTETFELAWRSALKRRVLIVVACLVMWACVIEGRLVALQVFEHDDMAQRAAHQQNHLITPAALRGDIVDRTGQMLAYSVGAESIFASPAEVVDPPSTIHALCQALGDCTPREVADLGTRLADDNGYAWVRRAKFVSADQAARVRALKLHGIGLIQETARYYPNFEVAAHVLGFVGVDNDGLSGVERAFDEEVRGQQGRLLVQMDAKSNWMQTRVEQAATVGATLELTLDLQLQEAVERALREGVDSTHAKSGTAIVMSPQTGEILALANYPTFNPNNYGTASEDDRRNRAVQDTYEPGSTFKIVTASAAIEEGVIGPHDLVDTNPGTITFPGRKPITETHGHNYGVIPFEDVIVKSSNIGAIRIGLRVGAERLSRYVRRFGFGQAIGDDFKGQSAGRVFGPSQLNDSELASMSMGYHVAVTPLQMALAASAVANGGSLMEPHVVRAIIRDGHREAIAPKVLRQSINADTAATMTSIMEGVVQRGTGTKAEVDNYPVAGKTGTAAKLVDKHYSETDYNTSFVGFVPSRRPALTIIVVIDSPQTALRVGGEVAAPVFKRIAEAGIRRFGISPMVNALPTVMVDAQPTIEAVPQPMPPSGPQTTMPDVRGLGARDALRVMGHAGLQVHLTGEGVVVAQTPEAGDPLEPGGWSTLQLQRAPKPAHPAKGSSR